MASVFLDSNDTFIVSNSNVKVYGGNGSEVVTVAAGVTGLVLDQSVERVALGGASSAFTYQQQGINLVVYSGSTVVTTVPLQAGANGTAITFTNGTVKAVVSSAGMTLGGTTVAQGTTATQATNVTPTIVDNTVVSTGGSTTTPISGSTFTLTTVVNYGPAFTGAAGDDTFIADETIDNVASIADSLVGGTGIDTLNIFNSKGNAPQTTGIEIITINTIADAVNFNAAINSTGLTTLNVIAAGGTNTFTVGAGVGVSLAKTVIDKGGDAAADVTVVYDAAATKASLTLNAVTSEGVGSSLGIEGAKLSQLDITTTGAASTIQELEIGDNAAAKSANIATLVVTGDQNLTITEGVDLLTGVANTITTTGLSGALDLGTGITKLAAKQDLTFNAGNGVNTVTFVDVDVDASITATFGSGKDVIELTDATGSVSINTGSGDDSLTISELDNKYNATDKETASFNLGAGNDTLTVATGLTEANLGTGVTLAGGDGTDTLKIYNAEYLALFDAVADTTVTGFEVLNAVDAGTYNLSKVSGLTTVHLTGAVAYTVTGMNATNAAAVTFSADPTTGTAESFALTDATGKSDILGLTFAHATANTAIVSDKMTVTGFETVNLTNTNGTGAVTAAFAAGANVTALNISGTGTGKATVSTANLTALTSFSAANAAGAVALTTAASQAGTFTLSSQSDTVALTASTGAATVNLGAGDDKITGLQADITALKSLAGGLGTDTLVLSDDATTTKTTTILDTTFKNITSGIEVVDIAGSEKGATTWALGGYANALASANSGVLTVTATTTLATAAADGLTIDSTGLSTGNALKLTISDTAVDKSKAATISVTNGAGNDVITITEGLADSTVKITVDAGAGDNTVTTTAILGATKVTTAEGADTVKVTTAGTAASNVVVSTGAGVDNITVIGSGKAGADYVNSITAGTGADIITLTNSTGTAAAYTVNKIVIAAGDSTVTAPDSITGFFIGAGNGTSVRKADTLDLTTNTVATDSAATDGTNYNTIQSHNIVSGIVKFDDVNSYTTALTVSSSNISDVLGYLQANVATGDTVAFTYDALADGIVDGTYVFQANATANVLVYLVGVTGTSVGAAADTLGIIGIV